MLSHEAIPSRFHALRKLGKYLANTYTENVKTVIDHYFTKSLTLTNALIQKKETILAKIKMTAQDYDKCIQENQIKSYQAIAEYSDREYNRLAADIKSDNFIKKKINIDKNEANIKLFNLNKSERPREEQSSYTIMMKNTIIDKNEIKQSESEYKEYLHRALENYIETCSMQNDFNSALILRIISLWFANKSVNEINVMMKNRIPTIPSYKFLLVLPQISAKIDTVNKDIFTQTIEALMGKRALNNNL